jgi:hypothetical protein
MYLPNLNGLGGPYVWVRRSYLGHSQVILFAKAQSWQGPPGSREFVLDYSRLVSRSFTVLVLSDL